MCTMVVRKTYSNIIFETVQNYSKLCSEVYRADVYLRDQNVQWYIFIYVLNL